MTEENIQQENSASQETQTAPVEEIASSPEAPETSAEENTEKTTTDSDADAGTETQPANEDSEIPSEESE